MMRGINHQNLFEEQEDYYQFLNTLDLMAQSYESDGTPADMSGDRFLTRADTGGRYMPPGASCLAYLAL